MSKSSFKTTLIDIVPNDSGGVTVSNRVKSGEVRTKDVPSFMLKEGSKFGDVLRDYAEKLQTEGELEVYFTLDEKETGGKIYKNLSMISDDDPGFKTKPSGKSSSSNSSGGYNSPENIAGLKAGAVIKIVGDLLGAEADEDSMVALGLKLLRVQESLEKSILGGTIATQQSAIPTQTKTPPKANVKKAVGGSSGPGF